MFSLQPFQLFFHTTWVNGANEPEMAVVINWQELAFLF